MESERSRRGALLWRAALIAVLVVTASCAKERTEDPNPADSGGTIAVSGAFALYPMVIRWSEEYRALHPQIAFDVSAGGAGKGMADALAGMVDIGMVSRPVYDAEANQGAFALAVAKDAVVCVASEQNPHAGRITSRGLTREDCATIWLEGTVETWGQLLESDGDEEIHVYTRADACGAAKTWAEFLGGYGQEQLLGVGVQADPGLAEAVRQDPLGIGYNNLNFAYDALTELPVEGLLVVPIDVDGSGSIEDQEGFYATKDALVEAIAEGRYPSPPSRPLYLVTRGKPDGVVADFLSWVLTDGQQYLAEVGYVTLGPDQVQAELSKLE
jgi:phosphate transport system substrate-binding protein